MPTVHPVSLPEVCLSLMLVAPLGMGNSSLPCDSAQWLILEFIVPFITIKFNISGFHMASAYCLLCWTPLFFTPSSFPDPRT
jgi:hypothetical protein